MMDSKVSIVVPIYNVEKYLNRCIESIVNQTYSNLEIILVDDGSPDGCPAMCDEWATKDARIKVIHKENEGAGLARNTGMEYVTGQYLLFVDSDDYIDITTIEKCMMQVKKHNADVVMFGRYNVSPTGEMHKLPMNTETRCFDRSEIINDLLPGFFIYEKGVGISVCMKLFNFNLIRQNKIRFLSEREVLSEDAIFNLQLFSYVLSAVILSENLYYYYKNTESFSHSFKENHQRLSDSFLKKGIEVCREKGYPSKISPYIQSKYHTYSLVGLLQIFSSSMSNKEKYEKVKNFSKYDVLRETLKRDVLKLDAFQSRVFWILLKWKWNWVCYFLLKYKADR